MGTTLPSRDQAPAWLPTAEIPLQRQAPPTRVTPLASTAPVAPQPARGRWPVAVTGIAVGLALGAVGVVGAAQAVTTQTTPPAADASAGYTANVSVPGRVLTSFGDGTWQIGVDVAPGTYASAGPVGPACHHALRRTRTGTDSAVDLGPATVVLTEADGWFTTSACATWKRIG